MTNAEIARILLAEARALAGRASALYRVRAYRQAAAWIALYPRELEGVYSQEGRPGLERIPGVGKHLSYTLEGLVTTGEVRHLTPTLSHHEPARQVTRLPGIGVTTAARLREEAGIETVEDLVPLLESQERPVAGIGQRRRAGLLRAINATISERSPPAGEPDIVDLLAVDAIFQQEIDEEEPLFVRPLTWSRAGFRFRVDLDRSALAHRLERVGDRVLVQFADGVSSGERVIETETEGDLTGQRVVRGRESECRQIPCGKA